MVEQTPQLPERRSPSRRTIRVVELDMTRVVGGNLVKDMSWYDNERGFTSQMIQVAVQQLGLDTPARV